MSDRENIWIVTAASETRGLGRREVKVDELSVNVNLFLDQLGSILERTPDKLGKFQFTEFEIHAEVSAKGTLAILGTGSEAGVTGGLKFVFHRAPAPQAEM
jgi:hypothetical protein